MKTDFYKYKNNKTYSTSIECFNKNVKLQYCNGEFKKTHLSKHIKTIHLNNNNENYKNLVSNNTVKLASSAEGASHVRGALHTEFALHNETNNNEINRALIVGPSFCGKTHLLINKLLLIRLDNPEKQIKIITRSPEQYENIQLEDFSVEENLEDRAIQDFQN